jgi:hypothetical protein
MKSIIFLIVSSDDHPVYSQMRSIIRLYMDKMKDVYPLKYFFIEFKNNLDRDIELINDIITVRGEESITPGMLLKTHMAMKYINLNYDYDLMIRTNLSSFWNIPHLFELTKGFPNENIAIGVIIGNTFISGTGIIVSKDICVKLSNIINSYESGYEDVLLSQYIQKVNNLAGLPENKLYYLIDAEHNKIPDDVSDILYFRVKSSGDREYDVIAFKELAKKIYNIEL